MGSEMCIRDRNIVTETTDKEITSVMSNSFGFGGTNASLVFSDSA